ncbi:hypothetical protein JW887_00120 [Candidatus Dojkabacteria bacterium]|nr:hypothetical protein [Candidatus Dojkabacteria bacterium]
MDKNNSTNTIFTDKFPNLKSKDELKEHINKDPFKSYDPYYVRCGVDPEMREFFNKMWRSYKPYADSNFIKDLKKHFHQRTWEMYVGYVLLKKTITIKSHNNDGPDFVVTIGDRDINIECVAPESGECLEKHNTDGQVHDVPNEDLQLRLTSAIRNKKEQYKKWLGNNKVTSSIPYILAINTFVDSWPTSWNHPRIINVLFGIGNQVVQIDKNTLDSKSFFKEESTLKNHNKEDIEKAIFMHLDYSFISAILFSQRDVINTPREKEGSDLRIVYNPNTTNKLEPDALKVFQEYKL